MLNRCLLRYARTDCEILAPALAYQFPYRENMIVTNASRSVVISSRNKRSQPYFYMSIPRTKPKIVNTRQFKHYNVNSFLSDLLIKNTINELSQNVLWEEWKNRFLLVADIHAPQIARKFRS